MFKFLLGIVFVVAFTACAIWADDRSRRQENILSAVALSGGAVAAVLFMLACLIATIYWFAIAIFH